MTSARELAPTRVSLGCGWRFGMLLAIIGGSSIAAAQEAPLEELIVVANKVSRPAHTIAANVSVLSRQDIKDQLVTSTGDLFQYTPGIDTEFAGTRFGNESINIRGIGGNRVATLIDGVPLGDQFDIGNFSNATRDFINTGLIQRAEILHGPASSLYGSHAIGGVVALYTPTPADIGDGDGRGGEVLTSYNDADDSRHVLATLASDSDTLGFVGAVSLREGHQLEAIDSPVEPDLRDPDLRDYRRQSVLLKVLADDLAGHSWRLTYIHQQSDTQSNSRSMLGTGQFRSTTQLLGDDEASMDLLSFEYDLQALDQWLDSSLIRAYLQRSEFNQNTVDERRSARTPQVIERGFFYQQDTAGLELNLQKSFDLGGFEHRVGFGLELRDKTTEELRTAQRTLIGNGNVSSSVLGETFPLRDFPVSDTTEQGAYLEYTLSADDWTAIAALRADRYRLTAKPDTIYREDNPATQVVSATESDVSPKLGLVYHLSPSSDLYLQYAHGFRAPPFEDANIGLDIPLFNIRAIPNPDLRSESSEGFELGFRIATQSSRFRIGVFQTDYDDFIETKVRLGLDPKSGRILFQSQNLSAAEIRGVEASWAADLPGNFNVLGSLYAAEGTNQDSGAALNSVGPAQLVLGSSWSSSEGKRALSLRATFTEPWNDLDESKGTLFKPEGYSTVDLFYRESLSNTVTVRASVRNLTDKKYWHWSSIRGVAPDDPSLAVLTAPGRHFSLSFEMSW